MRLFNKKRGPLAVTLNNGTSLLFKGKSWTEVPSGQESSPLLFHYIKIGLLYKEVLKEKKVKEILKKEEIILEKIQNSLPVIEVKEVKEEVVEEPSVKTDEIVSEVEIEVKSTKKSKKNNIA